MLELVKISSFRPMPVVQRPSAKPAPYTTVSEAQKYEADQILACFETELTLADDNEGF